MDFVLESGGKLSFAECKWQEHPGSREARNLSRVNAELEAAGGPWKPGEHYVLGRPAAASALAPGITVADVTHLPAILAGGSPLTE